MNPVHVLVVEDDEDFREVYGRFFDLHAEEFSWILAKTGDAALAALKREEFDVALIDWHLKGAKDGFSVLQALRADPKTSGVVAFMVTGNDQVRDVEAAIAAGADDYINKPFKMELLAARLRGRLNRARQQAPVESKALELDGLSLDEATGIVTLNGKRIDLYPTERALLAHFLKHPDRTFSPDQLWHAVRGYDSATAGEALGQQVRNLRKKLRAWGERVENRRGQGYLLNARFSVPQN